jgi:hypothetical protein
MWWASVCVLPWFCECGSIVSESDERAQRIVSAWATPASIVVAASTAAMRVSEECIGNLPFLDFTPSQHLGGRRLGRHKSVDLEAAQRESLTIWSRQKGVGSISTGLDGFFPIRSVAKARA